MKELFYFDYLSQLLGHSQVTSSPTFFEINGWAFKLVHKTLTILLYSKGGYAVQGLRPGGT
jgi:hypothetical protein